MKEYKTIKLAQCNNDNDVCIMDLLSNKMDILKHRRIDEVINLLNKEGYYLCGIGDGYFYMTKEI